MNISDILLDKDNRDPICLNDEKGRKVIFEQVAVISRQGKLYCILKPNTPLPDVADDEAIVFYVEIGVDGEEVLKMETDELVAIEVFEEYYKLFEDAARG